MDNKVIKVSVIIPVYQVENYLERAVDSVLGQTLDEIEIILVDDGSEDSSWEICDNYQRRFPEKISVIHKQNQGLGMARNSGINASKGEYIAFLDSDDTVEPQMYERMYAKAKEGNYDIVMCDVRILYVQENRTVEISSYPEEEIDTADYIANGNNITYSVNKLFKRNIWKENKYKKMLFEDISLIPALVSKYPHIGYVKEAFYNYYRRPNTISTSLTGNMEDIIQAYRDFIIDSSSNFHEESVYCAAKQIYWNMTESRTLFQADFIEFLKEYKHMFLLNNLVRQDKKVKNILSFIEKEVIPAHIICVTFKEKPSSRYLDIIQENFPNTKLTIAGKDYFPRNELPSSVCRAIEQGKYSFAEEYYALKILFMEGGIVIFPSMEPKLQLKKTRLNKIFFGFEDEEELTEGCFGALKNHYIIQALLDTYEKENIYNKALLPLRERLRDFLVVQFGLRVNGRNQLLKNEVQIYLPSVLVYDMKDGENCCKHVDFPVPEGYEVICSNVLQMWSARLMENWNLYKKQLSINGRTADEKRIGKISEEKEMKTAENALREQLNKEMEQKIQEVIDSYENSTCWKLTKPVRFFGKIFGMN